VWGAYTRSGSRGPAVLVNEPAESVPAVDLERIGGSGGAESGSRLGRDESEATMRTVGVVVIDVGVPDALELATAGDQDPVEALAPHGADEALGKRVCPRSLDRCSDDLDPRAAEDLVEGAAELRVAIVDQETWRGGSVGERPRQLARLLRDPGAAWMPVKAATWTLRLPSSIRKSSQPDAWQGLEDARTAW
jgi:hypothetical protein